MATVKVYRRLSKRPYGEVEMIVVELETAKAPYHPNRGEEPRFILEKARTINLDLKKRKAVWTIEKKKPDYLYFSCPWCLSVNKLEGHYAGVPGISVWCSGKCGRHLRIDLSPTAPRRKSETS